MENPDWKLPAIFPSCRGMKYTALVKANQLPETLSQEMVAITRLGTHDSIRQTPSAKFYTLLLLLLCRLKQFLDNHFNAF